MVDRSRLRKFMLESFNDDELADLIFDYFPTARSLMGTGMALSEKVRTLIDFAARHDRLDHLVVVVEKLRTDAYCKFFATDPDLPPEPVAAARDPNRIFISYANADAEFAGRLAADLRAQGYDIWIAPDSILPGEKWVAAIERGLRESGIFLLVLTPESADSKWVSQETQVAIILENEGQMRIFPLRVRRADVPLLLSTRQYISFEMDYDRGLRALLAVLRPSSSKPLPAPLPAPRAPVTETVVVDSTEYPVLIIDWPDQPNQEVTLSRMVTTLGRAADNDIVLALPIVSSHHLRLETVDEGSGYRVNIIDLGSRNGTFVGGRRVAPNTPQPLEPGDVVNLGDRVGRSISLVLRPAVPLAADVPLPPLARPAAPAHAPAPDAPLPAPVAPAAARPPAAGQDQTPAAKPAGANLPPPVAVPPAANGARLPATGPAAVPAPAEPLPAIAPSPPSRIPKWAYAVAGVVVIGLLALLLLRPGGDDATAEATLPATEAVAAIAALPTATETAATAEPTEAAPTSAPTDAPTKAPTAALVAAVATTAATDEAAPTAAPTETPAPAAVVLPTAAPGFVISRDSALGFETAGEWLRDAVYSRAEGDAAITAAQFHGGAHALQLAYDFASSGDDFVIFQSADGYRLDDDRERRILRVWVRGDGAPLMLSAIIEDNQGELWQVFLDQVSGTDWTQLDGYIGDTTWPSGILRNRGNGEVDFPVRLIGFLLDDATPSFIGTGAIYLDDVTAE